MIQRGTAVCLLLLFVIATAPASTSEWLSGRDLGQSCDLLLNDPENPEGLSCLAFIQGFIAGADAAEGVPAQDSAAVARSGDESYAERAARTRLGTLRLQQVHSMGAATYCIDDSMSAIEVVRRVTSYLEENTGTDDLTAFEAVKEALVHRFPCSG